MQATRESEFSGSLKEESHRLAAWQRYPLPSEAALPSEGFDALTRLAARLFHVPIALISFVDSDFAWFKSSVGLGRIVAIEREKFYFCDATLASDELCLVPDAKCDARFAASPFVQGENPVRFYAGVALCVPEGARVATLAIADHKTRAFSPADRELLLELGALASREIVHQRSENLFRALVENGSELLLLLSDEGRIFYLSPSFETILGYEVNALLGHSIFELVHSGDVSLARERVGSLVSRGALGREAAVVRIMHRDGSFRLFDFVGLNRLSDPAVRGLVINGRDITEEIAAIAQLEESRNRFQVAFEESSLGIALVSLEGHWLRANRTICEFLGYSEEELQGLDFQSVTHPDDLGADLALVQATLRGEIPRFSMEKRYLTARGEVVWAEINVALARGAGGEPLCFVSQVQDITARRAQEERLRLLESVAIHASDAIFITRAADPSESGPQIIYANRAFYAMTGYEENEVLGRTPHFLHGPQTSRETCEAMRHNLEACQSHTVEILNYKKDGTPFWAEVSLAPIYDQGGRVSHWVAFSRDVSRRKSDQARLQDALLEAKAASRAKSEFLSRMSHEFRTPLNAILGFAQLLEAAPLREKDLQSVGFIQHAGQHVLELVDEILDTARAENGRLTVQKTPVVLSGLAQELLEWVRPLAQERGLAIASCRDKAAFGETAFVSTEFLCSCDVLECSLVVLADARRMRQILLNLLSNAVKFNREGGAISLCCHETQREGESFARIGVRDCGQGISNERLQKLWTPFERLGAEQSGIQGSGIGLALSRQLARLMGGDLYCESQLGHGSIFWLELPLAEPVLTESLPASSRYWLRAREK